MPIEPHKEELIKFGKHLERLRKKQNLSLRKLANRCNIDFGDIKRYENGEVNLTFYSMLELAGALEISLRDLMDY
jgi:transcriptional regulator with XRE-family HTH domain